VQEETVCTAEFRLDLCQIGVKIGNAMIEPKIPAYPQKPDNLYPSSDS